MKSIKPPGLLHLLGPSARRIVRSSRRQATMRLIFLLAGLGLALAIFEVSVWFLRLCYGMEVVGPLLCRRLLDVVLSVLLGVLLLSNLVTALSSFFLADDLPLLVSAPVPPSALFYARFLQQLFHSSLMVLVFGLPVLFAFARVAGGPLTSLAVLLVMPPLLVLPGAVAAALVLLLVRLLPAGRVRAIVVAFSVIAFLVLYVAVRLMEPERMLNPEGLASVVQLLGSFSGGSGALLPSHWGTAVIAASFRDAASSGWMGSLAALWSAAIAACLIACVLFRRLHPVAYSHSLQSPAGSRARGSTAGFDWIRALAVLAPRGVRREMLIKDAKLLLRDASQWSQLLLLLALVFVYLFNFRYFRHMGDSGLIGQLALYLLGLGLAGFVTTAVSVRFVFPLVSLEGRVLWLLRSAPLEPGDLLTGKLLAALPPLLLVSETLSVVSSLILGVPLSLILFSAFFSALTTLAVGSMAVGLGAMLPDYGAESAAKVASSFGGLVCMTIVLLVGLLLTLLSIYPALLLHHEHRMTVHWLPLLLCVTGLLATTAAACVVPIRLGARALRKLEQA